MYVNCRGREAEEAALALDGARIKRDLPHARPLGTLFEVAIPERKFIRNEKALALFLCDPQVTHTPSPSRPSSEASCFTLHVHESILRQLTHLPPPRSRQVEGVYETHTPLWFRALLKVRRAPLFSPALSPLRFLTLPTCRPPCARRSDRLRRPSRRARLHLRRLRDATRLQARRARLRQHGRARIPDAQRGRVSPHVPVLHRGPHAQQRAGHRRPLHLGRHWRGRRGRPDGQGTPCPFSGPHYSPCIEGGPCTIAQCRPLSSHVTPPFLPRCVSRRSCGW